MNKLEIQTDRLELRLIEVADVEVIHRLHSFPETDEFNTLGIPENLQETLEVITPWIEDNNATEIRNYTFAIQHKTNGEFIGLFGLRLGPKNIRGLRYGINYISIIGIKVMQQNL
ncbi:GNAT family N-acetyltransferase [Maribacter spongiicola]|uniref:GNAT family N-acetyltransferase n=1 Tax=Maribacter spongiicola TaxID=1206753 RepID=UPI002444F7BC|nr:GNAT family N-acetyltransferase [Maribacter spongiicola]